MRWQRRGWGWSRSRSRPSSWTPRTLSRTWKVRSDLTWPDSLRASLIVSLCCVLRLSVVSTLTSQLYNWILRLKFTLLWVHSTLIISPLEGGQVRQVRQKWLLMSDVADCLPRTGLHWSITKLSSVCLHQIIISYSPRQSEYRSVWLSQKDKTRYFLIIFAQTAVRPVMSCKERVGLDWADRTSLTLDWPWPFHPELWRNMN